MSVTPPIPPDPTAGNPATLPTVSVPVPPVFETPNITQAQIVAFVTAVAGQLVAWGYMGNDSAQRYVAIAAIVLPAVLAVADSVVRHGRATGTARRL